MPAPERLAPLTDALARLEPSLTEGEGASILLVGSDDACGEALTALSRQRPNDVHRVDLEPVAAEPPEVAQGVLREKFDSAGETNAILFFERAGALFAAAAADHEDADAFTRLDYFVQRTKAYAGLVVVCLRDRAHAPDDRHFSAVVEL